MCLCVCFSHRLRDALIDCVCFVGEAFSVSMARVGFALAGYTLKPVGRLVRSDGVVVAGDVCIGFFDGV